ncbi:hypothetical protein PI124_g16046 [Phytophthora idaei]|nr:hypothetical protein PI125_g14696 [Phytophthora idaei]KAG3142234.1 hypothetical protein PI126_g15130 [Phytophthora idaei]KAG3239010.1 hypothetical protein PI124_g16046 [Phytophthora idaei]
MATEQGRAHHAVARRLIVTCAKTPCSYALSPADLPHDGLLAGPRDVCECTVQQLGDDPDAHHGERAEASYARGVLETSRAAQAKKWWGWLDGVLAMQPAKRLEQSLHPWVATGTAPRSETRPWCTV